MEFLSFWGVQWSGLANDFDDVAIVVGQKGNCFSKSDMSFLKAFGFECAAINNTNALLLLLLLLYLPVSCFQRTFSSFFT
jgi:hypothetical protein